jgi:hypothetical protein
MELAAAFRDSASSTIVTHNKYPAPAFSFTHHNPIYNPT